jgi:hypothetical protein
VRQVPLGNLMFKVLGLSWPRLSPVCGCAMSASTWPGDPATVVVMFSPDSMLVGLVFIGRHR